MEKCIKPIIPLWKVLLFSLGFFGVELFIMVFGITTPQFLGDFSTMSGVYSYLWLAIPVVGIFIQPIVGFIGDHIWSTYGRRGFFILIASSFGSVSILMLAFSSNVIASLILFIVVLVSINTLIVSYRTVVCEMTPPKERLAGYCMLTGLQLLGMLAAIFLKSYFSGDYNSASAQLGTLPPYLNGLMIICAIVLLITAFFGMFFLKEYPNVGFRRFVSYVPFTSESEVETILHGKISYIRQGAMWLSVATILFLVFVSSEFSFEVYIIPFTIVVFAILLMIAHKLNVSKNFLSQNEKRFTELMNDVMNMPFLMKKLNVVLLFAWFAIFLFLGNLSSILAENSELAFLSEYNTMGFSVTANCYIFFIIIAIITTSILIFTSKHSYYKHILSVSLFLEALFMILYYYNSTPLLFILCLVLFGVLLSIMFTLPYVLLSFKLPSRRVGVFFGLFNIFTIVPYILVPSISSSFVASVGGIHKETLVLSFVGLCFALVFSVLDDRG